MSKEISVLSKSSLLQVLKFSKLNDNIEKGLKRKIPLFVISITGTDDDQIFDKDYKNIIQLKFDDIDGHQDNCILFKKSMAEKILDFLDKIKKYESYSLVVQCKAGISRSGGVGIFALDYLEADKDFFNQMNMGIIPNIHIKSMLRRVEEDRFKLKNKS